MVVVAGESAVAPDGVADVHDEAVEMVDKVARVDDSFGATCCRRRRHGRFETAFVFPQEATEAREGADRGTEEEEIDECG